MSGKSVLGGLTAFQWKKKILTNILISWLVPSGAEERPRVLGRSVTWRLWAKARISARQRSPAQRGLERGPRFYRGKAR